LHEFILFVTAIPAFDETRVILFVQREVFYDCAPFHVSIILSSWIRNYVPPLSWFCWLQCCGDNRWYGAFGAYKVFGIFMSWNMLSSS